MVREAIANGVVNKNSAVNGPPIISTLQPCKGSQVLL
jgi:hypothetical protein